MKKLILYTLGNSLQILEVDEKGYRKTYALKYDIIDYRSLIHTDPQEIEKLLRKKKQ